MFYSTLLRDTFESEQHSLEKEMGECIKILQTAPKRNLQVHTKKGKPYFSVIKENDNRNTGKKAIYIRKGDPELRQLAAKYCAKHLLKILEEEKKKLKDNIEDYCPARIDLKKIELEKLFGDKMPRGLRPVRTIAETWAAGKYRQNPSHPDEKTIPTLKGDMVRSKIEAIVANLLYEWKIPYRYENPLVLPSGKNIFPDFTIISPYTGKVYYLEVCGLMEKPDYADRTARRIKDYSEAGIYFGKNLLFLMETNNVPMDVRVFREMLDYCLHA